MSDVFHYNKTAVAMPSPRDVWAFLPEVLRSAFLFSGSGASWLTACSASLAAAINEASPHAPQLRTILSDVALHLWETDLLSSQAAGIVLQLHGQSPFLKREIVPLCKMCASLQPEEGALAGKMRGLYVKGNFPSIKKMLDRNIGPGHGNIFWTRYASIIGLHLGDLDWYEPWVAQSGLPDPLAFVFRADYAFAREDWDLAAVLYSSAHAATGMTEWLVREGECHKRAGRRDEAAQCWQQALVRRPWQVNLLLRLSDLLHDHDLPGPLPQGQGYILFYSWNHAVDLDSALGALEASDLGDAGIIVLNNGSVDHTPEVIGAWEDRFGSRMRVITLPTNVGAPAARNWLLSTPEARKAHWLVFLDDDALVPPDWLGYMGAALQRHPRAGIVGCRVVGHSTPMSLQSVDLHINLPGGSKNGRQDNGLSLIDVHLHDLDFGQYSYMRHALSVTGCCHLLTRAGIAAGPFDLFFSPSQFDDLERDLRAVQQDIECVYQGHLRVEHCKRSGGTLAMSPRQIINAKGNFHKLNLSYPPHQLDKLYEKDVAKQDVHLIACLDSLL